MQVGRCQKAHFCKKPENNQWSQLFFEQPSHHLVSTSNKSTCLAHTTPHYRFTDWVKTFISDIKQSFNHHNLPVTQCWIRLFSLRIVLQAIPNHGNYRAGCYWSNNDVIPHQHKLLYWVENQKFLAQYGIGRNYFLFLKETTWPRFSFLPSSHCITLCFYATPDFMFQFCICEMGFSLPQD